MSQSTEKSLGQVLHEAKLPAQHGVSLLVPVPWHTLSQDQAAEMERMAQAVAAAVREQCAQVCDEYVRVATGVMNEDAVDAGTFLAAEIRSMEP